MICSSTDSDVRSTLKSGYSPPLYSMTSRRNSYRIFFTHLNVMFCLTIISAKKLSTVWFGPLDQFVCRCPENKCDNDGECLNGYECLHGWFGPSCQYVNLMAYVDELEPNVEALRDNSRSTYEVLNKLKVSWYAKYSFNWIRLVVSDTDQMNISSLHFFDNKDQLTIEKYSISKKDSTVDIHVALSKSAKRLEIEFVTDISLCTIFVSGGRNIALHMATTMSSTNDTNVASLAVDNEREMNSSDPTCTMTTDQDMSSPEWTVQFNSSVSIIGVIIYSKSPLSNLSVTIVRNQKTFKLSFNDILMKKDVVLLQLDKVVVAERLEITVQDSLLELCEVEIYGDETCESNKFGLLCDKPCDCRNKIKTCAIPTGACWSEFKGDFNDGCNKDNVLCGKPPDVDHGQWTDCVRVIGSNCSLTCDPDYELIGDPHITCQPNGRYTDPGICQRTILCGKPPDLDHGQWTECLGVVGSRCSLTCEADYELIGDPHITCQPNGRYTDPGICQRTILCGEPPDIRNGHWTECQRAIGSNCSLTCDPDYELIGDPHITCQPNGRYTGPGICQRIVSCGEPPTVNHGIWEKCERAIGSTCSLTCESNYELIGDSQVTCKTNGQYTGPGICKRIASCGDPPYVKNGHWTECQRVIWSRCLLTCNPDYELIGHPHITCQPNGIYTGHGICKYIVLCGEPPDVMNGTWSGQNDTFSKCEGKPGSRCSLKCDHDYELIGDPDITCEPDGRYTPSSGICQPILCGELPAVANGTWLPCTKQVGDTCTVICKKRYAMNGTGVVTCLNKENKGTWSVPGNCQPYVRIEVKKFDPVQPTDATRSSNSNNNNDSARHYIWLVPLVVALVVVAGCIYIHVRKKTEEEE